MTSGTYDSLQVGTIDLEQASISGVVGDLDISDLSIDSLDVDALAGGVVDNRGPVTRIDSSDLYIDENRELAWQDRSEGGFTDGSAHEHRETGCGRETIRPAEVVTVDYPVEKNHVEIIVLTHMSVD